MMSARDIAIQKVKDEMAQKEQKINEIQEELLRLKEKLEEYNNIPDSYYDITLGSCEDFPLKIGHLDYYYFCCAIGCKNPTIGDLIHSSPERLHEIRGVGTIKRKLIEEWMEKHELHFLS